MSGLRTPRSQPPASLDDATQAELAAVCNLKYALDFGYHFKYYVLDDHEAFLTPNGLNGCAHPLIGARQASWCNLLAVYAALVQDDKAYNVVYVVYVDRETVCTWLTCCTLTSLRNFSPPAHPARLRLFAWCCLFSFLRFLHLPRRRAR